MAAPYSEVVFSRKGDKITLTYDKNDPCADELTREISRILSAFGRDGIKSRKADDDPPPEIDPD